MCKKIDNLQYIKERNKQISNAISFLHLNFMKEKHATNQEKNEDNLSQDVISRNKRSINRHT